MTFSPSQIQDKQLENIIKNCNPFDREVIVTKQAIWKESFPDVPSINAAASYAVFKAIDKVSNGDRKVIGITHRAERGVGKSHIISRIRSGIKTEGNAFCQECPETLPCGPSKGGPHGILGKPSGAIAPGHL